MFRKGCVLTTMILMGLIGRLQAQEVPYGVGTWPEAGRGNHRALVRVESPVPAVRAHLPWRRRDRGPEKKDIRVFDAATGKQVTNVAVIRVARESGDIAFAPVTVPGDYEVYYLPYNPGTGNFDEAGSYFAPEDHASPEWCEAAHLNPAGITAGAWKSLPEASVVRFEARGEFNRMDPMEVIATQEETEALLAKYPDAAYLLFPEDRRFPVRMFENLPLKWVQPGSGLHFRGTAQPGEYYTFQIGVWAARQAISDLALTWTPVRNGAGDAIPQESITCFNLEGTDWLGTPFTKPFAVGQGEIRPLWLGVQIPRTATGNYRGEVRVSPAGMPACTVEVEIEAAGGVLENGGVDELWRMSRLQWLNSRLGLDDEVIPPFIPLKTDKNSIIMLGRRVEFGASGLPEQIWCGTRGLLSEPLRLEVLNGARPVSIEYKATQTIKLASECITNVYSGEAADLGMTVEVATEADGCLSYSAALKALSAVELEDVRLVIPLKRETAAYLMGFGERGGFRKKEVHWKWNVDHADNQVWLGDPEGGLQLTLQGEKNTWDVVTLHDSGLPASWSNGGQGGCDVVEEGETVLVRAYSGKRSLKAGEELKFRFRLLITPFKPIDPKHWNWRYGDVSGEANLLHIHHATPENPYINYPFLTADLLKATVERTKALKKETDSGMLRYPAEGNIHLDRGSLDLWVRLSFDPQAGSPRDARFNQSLFSLDFPNGDSLALYWNVDVRGLRAYTRQGNPEQNQYPSMVDGPAPGWQEGERHQVHLSWGDVLAIDVDGQRLGEGPYHAPEQEGLAEASLLFTGKGFGLETVKVSDAENTAAGAEVDAHTLLLDTFSRVDGSTTHPEKAAAGAVGSFSGEVKLEAGPSGRALRFSSRERSGETNGVNLYYTVRELSDHVAEMWPLRSLGNEIFTGTETFIYSVEKTMFGKAGGGYPWLQEHLVSGYVPAWRQPLPDGETDAAIGTQGLSRWHNYYVEGLQWLMRKTGVDGLYLDGIGYDREIMKRVAKVMQRNNSGYRINFHSGNNYDFMNWHTSPANSYMEHFPYLSNLWFGEMYDYDLPPDYWLVEVSGIPFGLTSEMLNYEHGGNAYRGMLYGMTGRLHPSAPAMWRFWDAFGIQDAEWLGYWNPRCPVSTDRADVLATVYRKPGKTLIALAHWPAPGDAAPVAPVHLKIDWAALGLDSARSTLTAPRIEHFQDGASFAPGAEIGVARARGWLLVLEEQNETKAQERH